MVVTPLSAIDAVSCYKNLKPLPPYSKMKVGAYVSDDQRLADRPVRQPASQSLIVHNAISVSETL